MINGVILHPAWPVGQNTNWGKGKGRSKSHDITSVISTIRLGNICSNDREGNFA